MQLYEENEEEKCGYENIIMLTIYKIIIKKKKKKKNENMVKGNKKIVKI